MISGQSEDSSVRASVQISRDGSQSDEPRVYVQVSERDASAIMLVPFESTTFRAEMRSPVLSAGVTIPSGVLRIPRQRVAADGARGRHGGRRVRRVRPVPDGISASDRMVLADHEINDEHDHKADDGPQQGPDDEEDAPHRRVHPAALGVPVHPEGPRDQDRKTDHADSYEEEQQSARQNLESCLHSQPRPHVPESILGYRDAARPLRDSSGLRNRDLPRRAVRVRPADKGVADALLEAAMLALDPDSRRKVVPVPRRLAAPRADLR